METELDETETSLRDDLLDTALALVPFDGWAVDIVNRAASQAGIEQSDALSAFPNGLRDIIRYWSQTLDQKMVSEASLEGSIRDKISGLILARLSAMENDKEAARRAAALLALPIHANLARDLTWSSADAMWRALSDASLDFNYYSKRMVLSAVWTSTLICWFSDETEDWAQTHSFLAQRMENVMQFEKLKATLRKTPLNLKDIVGFAASMRYRG